jgi:hypothetical protein
VPWQTFSFHFKQVYEEGYRYLDKCGEFMVHAVEKMDFVPGEIQITSAQLEKPEVGIKAAVNSSDLTVAQEQPSDGKDFFGACDGLAKLATELFRPRRVWSNGFMCRIYWPFNSPEAALRASLAVGDEYQVTLERTFGMKASHKGLDYHFAAGSYELRVNIQPVTFNRVTVARFNPQFRSSPEQRKRIERLNKQAERLKAGAAHVLMLDLDLIEYEPPEASDLERHFDQLLKAKRSAIEAFVVR